MQKSVYRYNDKSAVKVIAPVFVVEKKMWVFIYNDLYHMYQWGRYIALDGAKTALYNQIGNLNKFFSSEDWVNLIIVNLAHLGKEHLMENPTPTCLVFFFLK